MIFMIESLLFCHFHILVGIFHYRTWLVYSNDGLPQNALGLREQASWMHTHLVSFVLLDRSLIPTCEGIIVSIILSSVGHALIMNNDDHHTSFTFRLESHPYLWGNHSLHHPFLTWDNALKMMIITLLFTYNSGITTRYLEQNMTLYECLRQCTEMCNDS